MYVAGHMSVGSGAKLNRSVRLPNRFKHGVDLMLVQPLCIGMEWIAKKVIAAVDDAAGRRNEDAPRPERVHSAVVEAGSEARISGRVGIEPRESQEEAPRWRCGRDDLIYATEILPARRVRAVACRS